MVYAFLIVLIVVGQRDGQKKVLKNGKEKSIVDFYFINTTLKRRVYENLYLIYSVALE